MAYQFPEPETVIHLVSPQTLEFIGFTSQAAQIILSRFHEMDEESMNFTGDHIVPDELLTAARIYIQSKPDCSGTKADWNYCLIMMGLDAPMRSAIVYDDGDGFRFTRSCAEWALEFVETRFLELKELIDRRHANLPSHTIESALAHAGRSNQ